MAKTSMIMREKRREKLVKQHAAKRAQLKEAIRNPKSTDAEREEAQRLEGHARRELGGAAHVPEAVLGANTAVAGQVAAGLAHEPHGRPVDGLAGEGGEKPGAFFHNGVVVKGVLRFVTNRSWPLSPRKAHSKTG